MTALEFIGLGLAVIGAYALILIAIGALLTWRGLIRWRFTIVEGE